MIRSRSNAVTVGTGRLAWAVVILSAAVVGFELSLMRLLLISGWHHFAFLVISVALLGFGASGTLLCVWRSQLLSQRDGAMVGLVVATAIAIPLCAALAQRVPVEARFVPSLWWQQLGAWVLYWLIMAIPFLLGAMGIGLALMAAGHRVPIVYGSNLLGSGLGSCLATLAMWLVPPSWLAPVMGWVTLIGVIPLRVKTRWAKIAIVGVGALIITVQSWFWPPRLRIDPYKYLAYVMRLERQGLARRISVAHSPRGLVEVYRGQTFHDMPFLSVGVSPPAMDVVVVDGHWVGSVPRIQSVSEAGVVDGTLMAFAYGVGPTQPRVALLGERGLWNMWLALRHDASSVDVVQPDPKVFEVLADALGDGEAAVLSYPKVHPIVANPRHYLETTRQRFDIIQLVALEGSAAGSGGIGGLGQDHLVTVEGMAAALQRLTSEGLLFACRGIQTPPRDNLKLLATFVAALRRRGVANPQDHVVVVRDYLAVCTVVKASPWTPQQIDEIRRVYQQRQITPVWFPSIREDELNTPDALPGPAGLVEDWYHHGAKQLFSLGARRFIDQWHFDIRAPTDDRPFFFDFFKARSLGAMRQAYGSLWLTRVELGFLLVLVSMVLIGLFAAMFTVLPVWLLGGVRASPGKLRSAVYFTAIGLAYLMLEIMFLSQLTRLVGDPVQAASVTIATFLVGSGLGSMVAQRLIRVGSIIVLCAGVAVLVLLGLAMTLATQHWAAPVEGLPLWGRVAVAVAMVLPLAFLMGLPMPIGLARLQAHAPALVPWAWGVNGFASVMAPPLATAIGMTWGFSVSGLLAFGLYILAAVTGVGTGGGDTIQPQSDDDCCAQDGFIV